MLAVGIDLGTTNSAVTVGISGRDGTLRLETIPIDQVADQDGNIEQLRYLPSVALLPEEPSQPPQVGLWPYRCRKTEAQGRLALIKNHMGDDWFHSHQGRTWSPSEISALYLRRLLEAVSESGYGRVESAVITVPASFTESMKVATHQAAIQAGLDESRIYLLYEPVAALLNLVQALETQGPSNALVRRGLLNGSCGTCRVLVFDIGGGTVDVAIYELQEVVESGGYRIRAVGRGISPHVLLGGHRFDECLARYLLARAEREKMRLFSEDEREQIVGLWRSGCEELKKQLANAFQRYRHQHGAPPAPEEWPELRVSRSFPLPGDTWIPSVSYAELAEAISPLLGRDCIRPSRMDESDKGAVFTHAQHMMEPVWLTLQRAFGRIQPADVDLVLPVGGMACLPLIQDSLSACFGPERLAPVLPDFDLNLAVARGAAIHHHQMRAERSLLQTLLPTVELLVRKDETPSWHPLIPEGTHVHAGEPFRRTSNHIGFPAGRDHILLPMRVNRQVRGVARLEWPATQPLPTSPIPLEVEVEVDAQHTTMQARISSDGKELDIRFQVDETAPPVSLEQELQHESPDVPAGSAASPFLRRVRSQLFAMGPSPYAERLDEVLDLLRPALIHQHSRRFSRGGNLHLVLEPLGRNMSTARQILQAAIGPDGPADFLGESQRTRLQEMAPTIWKGLKDEFELVRAPQGIRMQYANQLLVVMGTLRSLAPAEAGSWFLSLAAQDSLRVEALHAFGRCVRGWETLRRLFDEIPNWDLNRPIAVYWALSRALVANDFPKEALPRTGLHRIENMARRIADHLKSQPASWTDPNTSRMAGVALLAMTGLRIRWPELLTSDSPTGNIVLSTLRSLPPIPISGPDRTNFWDLVAGALEGHVPAEEGLVKFLAIALT